MPGFFGLIEPDIGKERGYNFDLTEFREIVRESVYFDHAYFTSGHFERFSRDHCFAAYHDQFIGFNGTFLNRSELAARHSCKGNAELIGLLLRKHSDDFVKQMRGDFAGFVYNSWQNSLLLFTSFYNEKPIFYLSDQQNRRFLFCTSFHDAVKGAGKAGITLTLSEKACYSLLTFGHMLDDETLFCEIRKMPPASVLSFKNGALSIEQYYTLNDLEPLKMSRKEMIDNLDAAFSSAISAEYGKDLEHGLKHLVTLSGGLDSRMSLFYAEKLGFKDFHTLTFSQPGYLDDSISQKIAAENNYGRTFISLDPGDFLKDVKGPVQANGGLAAYFGGAATYHAVSSLDVGGYGLLHSGQLGDAILGTYLSEPKHTVANEGHIRQMAICSDFYHKIPKEDILRITEKYRSAEILRFYVRGVNYIFNGNIMLHQFMEQASPFLFPEFVDFAFRIEPGIRYKEFFYIDWIAAKLSKANKYKWEKYKVRPLPFYFNDYFFLYPRIKKAVYVLLFQKGILPKFHMNPVEYWARTNADLNGTVHRLIEDNLYLVEKTPELKKDLISLNNSGKFVYKGLAATLLAALASYTE